MAFERFRDFLESRGVNVPERFWSLLSQDERDAWDNVVHRGDHFNEEIEDSDYE